MGLYHKYRKKAKRFLAMTSHTVEEFDALLPPFTKSFYEHMAKYTLRGKERQQRAYVDYKNSPLPTIEEKLFFILVYLKTYPLQEVQAAMFGMNQPQAHAWIHCVQTILQKALVALCAMPARTLEELTLQFKGQCLFFHDGTERPIPRPFDPSRQQHFYSGKARTHTIKNNLLIDDTCRILFLTATVEGKMHDKKLADQAGYTLPPGSQLAQDTGFQGFSLDKVAILQPKKKPKGASLTDWQKLTNHALSSLRIRIEHAIGSVQRLRIVKDKIRNWKAGFRHAVMATACAIHNFRLTFRPWHYGPLQLPLFLDL
jgi:hypothetical protein